MAYSPIPIDDVIGAVKIIDVDHHEIHEGESYVATYFTSGVGSGSNVDVRVLAPDTSTRIHMLASAFGSVEFEFLIYEAGNVTVGTDLDAINRDRNSANTATIEIAHTPTVTTTGNLIWNGRFGAGVKSGGEIRGENEFILDQNGTYLFRVTSRAASNSITMTFNWYEES